MKDRHMARKHIDSLKQENKLLKNQIETKVKELKDAKHEYELEIKSLKSEVENLTIKIEQEQESTHLDSKLVQIVAASSLDYKITKNVGVGTASEESLKYKQNKFNYFMKALFKSDFNNLFTDHVESSSVKIKDIKSILGEVFLFYKQKKDLGGSFVRSLMKGNSMTQFQACFFVIIALFIN